MFEYVDGEYTWRQIRTFSSGSIRKGEYLAEKYYIVEVYKDESAYFRRSELCFCPCENYEDKNDFIESIDEYDLEGTADVECDFVMDCITLYDAIFLSEETENDELQIIFDEFGGKEDMMFALRKKKSKKYKVYEYDEYLFDDYEVEELNETLLGEYGLDILDEELNEEFSFWDGVALFWFCEQLSKS